MLIEFRVENYRSLRDEQVLTMVAGRVGDEADPRPRQIVGLAERLLPIAVLYGANASGKSNVLAALAFMRDAVVLSHRIWPPDEGVPRDPFAWGPKRSEPSLFEVTALISGVRHQYGFSVNDECVLEEWLYAWPNRKKQVWFERDCKKFEFGENLKGENKLIEAVTRPNALFISAAAQHKHQQLTPIFSWFRTINGVNFAGRQAVSDPPLHEMALARLLDDDGVEVRQLTSSSLETSKEPLRERFRTLLRNADIGITDIGVNRGHPDKWARQSSGPHRFWLKHQSESDDSWMPLEEESHGTQTLFRLALPILQAIQEGGILLVDELEASLHPTLAQHIVRQFNDPTTNPRNAQLLFATQDTNLLGTTLGEPTLRRDQVWLTEKDGEGATMVYPLSDYKPRKAENLERGYLQGRYGATPYLGHFRVSGE